MIKALPEMFPSSIAPLKKLEHASDRMLHILESAEDPSSFLQARPLLSPVVIVCETNCIPAIGTVPELIFPKEDIADSALIEQAKHPSSSAEIVVVISNRPGVQGLKRTSLAGIQTRVKINTQHVC
ncbi:Trifunctional purine biosynthetic protein adenosine-3, partial [Nibea albiflora]